MSTYCPTCGRNTKDLNATKEYCDELCELRSHMDTGSALKIQAMRRNTEAIEKLTTALLRDKP